MPEIIVPDYSELIVAELDFDEPAQVNRSLWTGTRKVVGLPGAAVWQGKVRVQSIATETEERPWRAFLAGLRGVQNWFKVLLPCQSHIGPSPMVDVGASNGYSLPLTGMSPDTILLKAGQHITVPLPSGHARAVRLVSDLITNSVGKAVANIAPALTEIPIAGTVVETANPYVPMSSATTRLSMPIDNAVSGFAFDVEEAR